VHALLHKGCDNSNVSQMSQPVHISLPHHSCLTACLYACFGCGRQTFPPEGFQTLLCMYVCAQADIFNRTWSCWCIRAYLSSEKRAPQAPSSHRPFTEQQRGEGQGKIDAHTELCLQSLHLVTVFSPYSLA